MSAILPQGLASRTFLARPTERKATPRATRASVTSRLFSWSAISEKRTIGPATSCGNIETKQAKSTKLRIGAARPRQTSIE